MSTLLDDAFDLLEKASQVEENAKSENYKTELCMEAATKYYEACNQMKMYLQEKQTSSQSDKLIREKISHYEKHATNLLRIEGRKSAQDPSLPMAYPVVTGRGGVEDDSQSGGLNSSFSSVATAEMEIPLVARLKRWKLSLPSRINPRSGTEKEADAKLATAIELDEGGNSKGALEKYNEAAEIYVSARNRCDKSVGGGKATKDRLTRKLEGAIDRMEQIKRR